MLTELGTIESAWKRQLDREQKKGAQLAEMLKAATAKAGEAVALREHLENTTWETENLRQQMQNAQGKMALLEQTWLEHLQELEAARREIVELNTLVRLGECISFTWPRF